MSVRTLFPGVALVTGAGGTGIGAAVARAFALAGFERIAITDVSSDTLEQTKQAIATAHPNVHLLAHSGNMADDQFAGIFTEKVIRLFGRLNYAVNSAGILGRSMRSGDVDIAEFDRVTNINYRGCWLSSRAQLKKMVKQDPFPSHDPSRPPQRGAVVNIASQLGIVGHPNASIIGLTRADAIDYSPDGIGVNCVCPGVVETPLIMQNPEVREAIAPAAQISPMKRMGTPSEVADANLFLCSPPGGESAISFRDSSRSVHNDKV